MSHRCERKDKKDSHKESHKTCHKEKFETLDKLKVRDLCVKNLKVVDITTKTITGATGTFDNLVVNNATINNLNATTINGRDVNCDNSPFNFSGVITPVSYVNGVPQQPANPGNFNQAVLDDLWNLNVLANAVTNLDADSGRLRNAILNNFYGCETCPATNLSGCTGATGPFGCSNQGYSVFTGSIAAGTLGATGTILTVTSVSNESLTDCPPAVRPIQVGQMVFLQDTNTSFPSSTIVSQLTGTPGSTGTYLISNNFNDYSSVIPSQTMLALSNRMTNECVNVPLRIYGVETLSVGPTGPCGNIISAIAYNINIANKTLNTRVAAVYVQVGWQPLGTTGPTSVNIQGLSIDTRQFDPSVLSFGEQMNNNVLLPTNLIERIATLNVFSTTINAVVQLVVYIEDGLEVLIPDTTAAFSSELGSSKISSREISSKDVSISQTNPLTSNYSASLVRSNVFDSNLQKTFSIPENATNVRFTLFGGGGGGGSGDPNGGAGGGGGNGFSTGEINLNLAGIGYTTILVLLGKGGESDQDGFDSKLTFTGQSRTADYRAPGGKAGGRGKYSQEDDSNQGGNGGDGYFGGGGGAGLNKGFGGNGFMSGCPDGRPGQEIVGGDGGSINCSDGGKGGSGYTDYPNYAQGGGGGGGPGGGPGGGNGILDPNFSDERNARPGSAAGGGGGGGHLGGFGANNGGRGGDGYIDGPYFT